MKKALVILAAVLLIAAVTKPSENSFNSYIDKQLESKSDDNFLSNVVNSATSLVNRVTSNYEDKIFFSTAETKISGKSKTYIGVFGFWF